MIEVYDLPKHGKCVLSSDAIRMMGSRYFFMKAIKNGTIKRFTIPAVFRIYNKLPGRATFVLIEQVNTALTETRVIEKGKAK